MADEYSVIERENNDRHALFELDQKASFLYRHEPVLLQEPIRLRPGKPIPKAPQLVDHHALPGPVFSPRIKAVRETLFPKRMQLLPAELHVASHVFPYWILHVCDIYSLHRQETL